MSLLKSISLWNRPSMQEEEGCLGADNGFWLYYWWLKSCVVISAHSQQWSCCQRTSTLAPCNYQHQLQSAGSNYCVSVRSMESRASSDRTSQHCIAASRNNDPAGLLCFIPNVGQPSGCTPPTPQPTPSIPEAPSSRWSLKSTVGAPKLENYSCGCLLGCVLLPDPLCFLIPPGAALAIESRDATEGMEEGGGGGGGWG